MNVIVGENNVGKSNLLRAIDFLRKLPLQQIPITWWPEGKGKGVLSAYVDLEFNSTELERVDTFLRRNADYKVIEPFHEFFGNRLQFKASWHGPSVNPQYDITMQSSRGKETAKITPSIGNDVVATPNGATFGGPIYSLLYQMLDESFISFPEFRQRPGISAAEVLKSTVGTDVAPVLFLLKNGEKEAQRRFQLIKRYFSLLFPTLRMEVSKPPNNQPRILVEKKSTRHELPLDWIGAGIAEMLTILTHVVKERHKIIVLDEPELHLHPHSQRLLRDFLREASTFNQIIIVTHSPQFVDLADLDSIILVREVGARSQIKTLPKDLLTAEENKKISTTLQTQEKEFLFSRSVLLVEGPTEYGAMPILAKRMKRSFDENGVSLVSVEGNYFGLMLKLLHGFDFSWRAVCDKDALMNISRGRITESGKDIKTSQVFNSLFNANLLSKSDIEQLRTAEIHIRSLKDHGKITEIYSESQFAGLNKIAMHRGFKVLVPDFEGIFAKEDHGRLIQRSRQAHGTNKRLQGVYLAYNAKNIPRPLQQIISSVSN